MNTQASAQQLRRATTTALLVIALLGLAAPTAAQTTTGHAPPDFEEMAAQGFGDRQNSYIWSLAWWKGRLYVGTGRSTQCVMHATGHLYYPFLLSYPPLDPDIACTPDSADLPLQAEIWRWTPQTGAWERVYQSPNDVPIPGAPGHFVARDIGFRSMLVFQEPDGTEALYVGGVSSNTYNAGVPGARILRSTDGVHFAPLPQAPGTFLGERQATSFRSLTAHRGRLFVIATLGYAGFGPVLMADDPARGNNNFRFALPEDITAFELQTHNGCLYIGAGTNPFADLGREPEPFSVLRTEAQGQPPYTPITVVAQGGFRQSRPSYSVVSMHVFKGDLYVGTDQPAELIRIHPDDSWDLIVGTPRWTPAGFKRPLSGMDVGFDNPLNIHMWRMATYRGRLYVGTMDQSTKWRHMPFIGRWIKPLMGFDLYSSADGERFNLITRDGFGDPFDVGVRNLEATPHGLALGTANQYYGARLYRHSGQPHLAEVPQSEAPFRTYLAFVANSVVNPARFADPEALEVAAAGEAAALAWVGSPGAARYRVFRADFISNQQLRIPDVETTAWIPGQFQEVGLASAPAFVDPTARPGAVYHYYVQAETAAGDVSAASNLARFPPLPLEPAQP